MWVFDGETWEGDGPKSQPAAESPRFDRNQEFVPEIHVEEILPTSRREELLIIPIAVP